MADLRAYQPSFTAGVLSPALWARVDLAKYATGLKRGRNLFIHPHGGASNRSGLEFVGEVKNSANKARMIPFQFNTEQSYELEFGHLYFRVWINGGRVLSGGSPYELVTPYGQAQLDDLVFIQEADVMYICHPSHAPRKLARMADDNWSLTTVTFAPSISAPTGLAGSALFTRRSGDTNNITYKVSAVAANGAESAVSGGVVILLQWGTEDGRLVKLSWNAASGASFYRIYREGADQGILAETSETTVYLQQSSIQGDGTAPPTVADPGAPPTPTGFTGEIVYGLEAKYVVSAIDEDTGEESLPSAPITLTNDMSYRGNRNTLSWNAVAGASAYIVYRSDNGSYGYIGRTEITSFIDENITPDLADGPQSARNPFSGAGNYPRCVTFIEQRLGFFSSNNEPQGAWLSQSANYENFGVSEPAKASDAVTFRIKAREVNEIRAALPVQRGLMLLTSGAEWLVSGGTQSDAISPSAIKIDNQGYRGCAKVQPIVVGNIVLFAQNFGGVVRDFSYQFENDSFVGRDLTIMARHFFENKSIKAWAYAQAPYSIVWVVLDDGSLVSLTYMKEHDVWAWTDHESAGGYFEDVSVIAENGENVPYFIVRRTINGQTKRYIERLHTRSMADVTDAFFVDSGLTYDGAATDTISGLDHLEGESVVALADGNVVRNLTVSGGSVKLPISASKVHVGLPMEATLQTLDLDLGQVRGLGTVQGRYKSISEVTMRVEQTRGIFVGPYDGDRDSDHLVEYKQRATEAWDEAIQLYTGDISISVPWDWNTHGNVVVKQFDPLPMTILAIMPDVTIGR